MGSQSELRGEAEEGSRNMLGGRVKALQVAEEVGFLVGGGDPQGQLCPASQVQAVLQGSAGEEQVPASIQLCVGHRGPQVCHAVIPRLTLQSHHSA